MAEPDLDIDKLDDAALAILSLTLHDGNRVWKGIDWSITDRLHAKGLIHDPIGKTKSLALTEDGEWVEINPMNERLVRAETGAKQDAERNRKRDVIMTLLFDEAAEGRLYTSTQFGAAFENQHGLGSQYTIRERLNVLATKGMVKFCREMTEHGYAPTRSHFGYLCVEGMRFGRDPVIDPDTGEVLAEGQMVLPTHFKCPHSGRAKEVENPAVWVYPEGLDE